MKMPLPFSVITSGLPAALCVIVAIAFRTPTTLGANRTVRMQVPPGGSVVGASSGRHGPEIW